jgi:anti-sigma-K factor RskA
MIDERKEAQASLYVLGAMPAAEARDFEQALRTDLQLQMLVKELRGAADAMVATFPRVEPPPALKQSVLAAIGQRSSAAGGVIPVDFSRWQVWVPWALAASFALLCVLLLGNTQRLRQQVADSEQKSDELSNQAGTMRDLQQRTQVEAERVASNYQQRLATAQNQAQQGVQEIQQIRKNFEQSRQQLQQSQTQNRQLARQAQQQQELIDELQDAILANPSQVDALADLALVVLNPTADAENRTAVAAAAFNVRDHRGLLVVNGLSALPADRDYQLWLFNAGNPAPISAGVFQSDGRGRVRFLYRGVNGVDALQRAAISIERKGGAPAPQGKIVLAGS